VYSCSPEDSQLAQSCHSFFSKYMSLPFDSARHTGDQ